MTEDQKNQVLYTMTCMEYLGQCLDNGATEEQALQELKTDEAQEIIVERMKQILSV